MLCLARRAPLLRTAAPRPPTHARSYAIPGRTHAKSTSASAHLGIAAPHSHSFTRPMLATWAACCILFGASLGAIGTAKGWIRLGAAPQRIALAAAEADSDGDDEARALKLEEAATAALLETSAARECLASPDEWKRVPYFWPPVKRGAKAPFVPGAMLGPGGLRVEPVAFMHRDRKRFVVVAHTGERLCGHPGIVHGGVQATLFDEITARPAFRNLPRNIALTASLKINYRQPVPAGTPLVFRTELTAMDGRKATVVARLEDDRGTLLSDAEALYVSPKSDGILPDRSAMVAQFESTYPGNF
ncbi:hypothetical protein H4R18_005057 [Coemansia javaensis]|uniref:Thioesterase domain-containing protein n=1 Tax=Coemansia javaensis TaxID=2761396 RepID=A0A9W8H9U5_9FUNG|nr:hypothetical protein H4R18_005057 [Coemansia javaensis]